MTRDGVSTTTLTGAQRTVSQPTRKAASPGPDDRKGDQIGVSRPGPYDAGRVLILKP
ncbi:hypothetical protein SDC9_83081 [bioreactor metagenome]|uniref:Uncharacterized protein n=1 Tax=bioreactor metagenome TaxID=1076179 RepID=A0A644ZCN7_9ZZZZ